jgi:hypothetical protein
MTLGALARAWYPTLGTNLIRLMYVGHFDAQLPAALTSCIAVLAVTTVAAICHPLVPRRI